MGGMPPPPLPLMMTPFLCCCSQWSNDDCLRKPLPPVKFWGHGWWWHTLKLKIFPFSLFSLQSNGSTNYSTVGSRHHERRPYGSGLRALAIILREEGPKGLYKGLVPAIFSCTQGGVQVCLSGREIEWRVILFSTHLPNISVFSQIVAPCHMSGSGFVSYMTDFYQFHIEAGNIWVA